MSPDPQIVNFGPGVGKYHDVAVDLGRRLGFPKALLVIVVEGPNGTGFEALLRDPLAAKAIPHVLRDVADQIERQTP